MRNNLSKYLVIISVLFNFSFLGAAGFTYFRQPRHPSPPFGFEGPAPCESGGQGYPFEKLSLSPEQIKLFKQKAALFHQALDRKRTDIHRLRDSLLSLMRAETPDRKSIKAAIGKINGAQEEMQKMVIQHILEFKAMLDPAQQEKFMALIEGAMAQRKEAVCP